MAKKMTQVQLSALRLADERAFVKIVKSALFKTGTVPDAAQELGVHRRTLSRWIVVLPELLKGVEVRGR